MRSALGPGNLGALLKRYTRKGIGFESPSPVPESSTRANRRASENERESEKSNRALRNIYAVFTHFYGAILQVKFPLKNASLRFMTKVLRFPR